MKRLWQILTFKTMKTKNKEQLAKELRIELMTNALNKEKIGELKCKMAGLITTNCSESNKGLYEKLKKAKNVGRRNAKK